MPIGISWSKGHEAVVRLLLETGQVDVNLRDPDGRTPLSLAAEIGHIAVVRLLLETGRVDVNSKDCDGHTPLSFAAWKGHEGWWGCYERLRGCTRCVNITTSLPLTSIVDKK